MAKQQYPIETTPVELLRNDENRSVEREKNEQILYFFWSQKFTWEIIENDWLNYICDNIAVYIHFASNCSVTNSSAHVPVMW